LAGGDPASFLAGLIGNFSFFVANQKRLEPRHADWLKRSAWLSYFGWATFHLDRRGRRNNK